MAVERFGFSQKHVLLDIEGTTTSISFVKVIYISLKKHVKTIRLVNLTYSAYLGCFVPILPRKSQPLRGESMERARISSRFEITEGSGIGNFHYTYFFSRRNNLVIFSYSVLLI